VPRTRISRKVRASSSAAKIRNKVRAHRARLRAKGLRPVTIWVPNTRSSKFAAEARRQCALANKSRHATEDQAWVDMMSAGSGR
jgi:hypothetical protein